MIYWQHLLCYTLKPLLNLKYDLHGQNHFATDLWTDIFLSSIPLRHYWRSNVARYICHSFHQSYSRLPLVIPDCSSQVCQFHFLWTGCTVHFSLFTIITPTHIIFKKTDSFSKLRVKVKCNNIFLTCSFWYHIPVILQGKISFPSGISVF